MGGHSSRSTGARHLARTGVEVYIIQLLARHSSAIILHYVKNIPLEVLTEHYLREKEGRNLESVLEEFASNKTGVIEAMSKLKMDVSEALENESSMQLDIDKLSKLDTVMKYVVNADSGVTHVPFIYHKQSIPTSMTSWRTRCGWKFGNKNFRWMVDAPTQEENVCDRCLPDLKANMTGISDGTSSSSSDRSE